VQSVILRAGGSKGPEVANFPQAGFIEVKAVNAPSYFWGFLGGLHLSSINGQVQGLLDVAFQKWPKIVPSSILFLTTSNTDISRDTLMWATSHGVAVWQAKAYAVPDPSDPGKYLIGFKPAELLNTELRDTYQKAWRALNVDYDIENPLPNGSGLGRLGRTINVAPTFVNPDPTFQP
jgi:hypothetical protein